MLYRSLLLGLSVSISLSACVDVRKVLNQTVTLETPLVIGAECTLTDNKGDVWYTDDTPAVITVKNGHGPMTIECNREGYKRSITTISEDYPYTIDYEHVIASAFGGLSDAASHIGKRYPMKFVVLMEPEIFVSTDEKREWLDVKHSYEKMYHERDRFARYKEVDEIDRRLHELSVDNARRNFEQRKLAIKAERWVDGKRTTVKDIKNIKKKISTINTLNDEIKMMRNHTQVEKKSIIATEHHKKNKRISKPKAEIYSKEDIISVIDLSDSERMEIDNKTKKIPMMFRKKYVKDRKELPHVKERSRISNIEVINKSKNSNSPIPLLGNIEHAP